MDFYPNHRVLLLCCLFGLSAHGKALYAPQVCSPKEMEVFVTNPAKEDREFWLQVRRQNQVIEHNVKIEAGQQIKIPGTEILMPGAAFSVRTHENDLRFILSCRGLMRMSSLASPRVEYDLDGELGPFFLRLQNLHHSAQNVNVSFLSAEGLTLHEINLELENNYVSSETRLKPPMGTVKIVVEGSARLSSQVMVATNGRMLTTRVPQPAKVAVDPSKAYFLASNGEESFVVPLADPLLISKARDIVARQAPLITFAVIEAAEQASENRDLLAQDAAPWSWRVKSVEGFDMIGSQFCSGSPSVAEDFKEAWMPSDRPICFWSFYLKRELTPDEVTYGMP